MSQVDPAPEPVLAVIEDVAASATASSSSSTSSAPPCAAADDNAPPSPPSAPDSGAFLLFSVKYAGSILSVRLGDEDSVSDLKAILYSLTDVPPVSQKLLGITRGKPPTDDDLIGSIQFAPSALKSRPQPPTTISSSGAAHQAAACGETMVTDKVHVSFMLLGTPEADRFQDPSGTIVFAEDLDDRFKGDIDYTDTVVDAKSASPPDLDPKNRHKLEKVIKRFSNFSIMNEPRPGKRLLVLDLDYTIADTKRLLDPASPASLAARPGLHDFLTVAYRDYDICIWSQTSWRWLEVKLVELGMIGHAGYNVSFVLDRTPMFSITAPGGRKHEVKPLELIWRRWPALYGPHNTLHVDDLSRNFAMNPQNGLKIRAYKHAPKFDTELVGIARYLRQLAHDSVDDFRKIDNKDWRNFTGPEKHD